MSTDFGVLQSFTFIHPCEKSHDGAAKLIDPFPSTHWAALDEDKAIELWDGVFDEDIEIEDYTSLRNEIYDNHVTETGKGIDLCLSNYKDIPVDDCEAIGSLAFASSEVCDKYRVLLAMDNESQVDGNPRWPIIRKRAAWKFLFANVRPGGTNHYCRTENQEHDSMLQDQAKQYYNLLQIQHDLMPNLSVEELTLSLQSLSDGGGDWISQANKLIIKKSIEENKMEYVNREWDRILAEASRANIANKLKTWVSDYGLSAEKANHMMNQWDEVTEKSLLVTKLDGGFLSGAKSPLMSRTKDQAEHKNISKLTKRKRKREYSADSDSEESDSKSKCTRVKLNKKTHFDKDSEDSSGPENSSSPASSKLEIDSVREFLQFACRIDKDAKPISFADLLQVFEKYCSNHNSFKQVGTVKPSTFAKHLKLINAGDLKGAITCNRRGKQRTMYYFNIMTP